MSPSEAPHPGRRQVEPLHNWEPEEVWKVGVEKKAEKGRRHWTTQCTEMLPAMLHGNAALAPYCLKNCDQDAAWRIYPKGVWFGEGPGPAGGCAQQGAQIWNQMTSGSCWRVLWRKFRYWNKMNAGNCWGAPGRNLRHWNKMNQEVCGEARPGGSVDIQTIWAQRYWAQIVTQMTMHARSCGETRGRSLDIETAWTQEVAERHRCVRA